jgi:predicted peptidase
MKKSLILWLLFIVVFQTARAQADSLYEKHWLIEKQDTLPYRLLIPKNYNPTVKYPIVIFLHGAGEKGSDNEAQLAHGSALFLNDSVREKFPAFILFPQCSKNSSWVKAQVTEDAAKKRNFNFIVDGEPTISMKLLIQLIETLKKDYNLDRSRFYVGGLSMGGMGTFELVNRKSGEYAAAFPICGGGNAITAPQLVKTKWWIFHGLKDDVVPPELSQTMADAIKAKGGKVKLTLYPEANHNSWDPAFAEKELLPWLFSNHK